MQGRLDGLRLGALQGELGLKSSAQCVPRLWGQWQLQGISSISNGDERWQQRIHKQAPVLGPALQQSSNKCSKPLAQDKDVDLSSLSYILVHHGFLCVGVRPTHGSPACPTP